MNLYIVGSAVAFWFTALAGAFYWTRRYVRAIEARTEDRERIASLERRLAALEAPRPPVTEMLAGELDRREAEADTTPEAGEEWPVIKSSLAKKLR